MFKGFETPKENYSKLPHALVGALPIFSSLAELKVVLYVLRHTWGYQEFAELKRITLDEFRSGRRRKDGSRMDQGVGMSENAIMDGLSRAIEHGFLVHDKYYRHRPGRPAGAYMLRISSEVEENSVNKPQELRVESSEVEDSSEKDTLERNPEEKKDTAISSYTPGPDQLVSCVDPDTDEEVGEEDWRSPSTQLQAQAFCVCGRSRFYSKAERNKLERIEAMLESGKLPEEFWKNRLWSAEQYRWSLPKLLKYTLSEDSLRDWEAKQ